MTAGEPIPGPSDEQLAVLAFEKDLVVTAGAGSGKTRTLVELYATLLREPARIGREEIRPSEILCLTFTERAAREILGRIRESVDDPARLRELESAPIGTFHGWCAALLRDYPLEAGLDPRFIVLSEDAARDLLFEAAIETLRRGLESGDRPARIAVEILGLYRGAAKLADLVREARTAGWSEREPITRFEARLQEVAAEAHGPLARAVDRAATELADTVRGTVTTPLGRRHLEAFDTARVRWRSERSQDAADALTEAAKAPAHSWKGATGLRHAVIAELDTWRQARHEVDHAPQLGAWPALTVSVRSAYRAARLARAALDYDDLLLRTRDLLTGHGEILDAVRGRHRVILVDEHQDTDPVQHEILRLLLGDALRGDGAGPRWCVVGDVRQSIYGFRGATVEALAGLAREAEARGAHRTLAFNYRSRSELIAFHNAFFPHLLTAGPHAETLAYVAQRAWRPEAPGPAVELLISEDEGAAADLREVEALALAARIGAACDGDDPAAIHVWDHGTERWRVARHGDVVILMRKLTQVEPYRRALQAVGIETVVTGSGEFYRRQEIFDVLNALEAAIAPDDPVPLVAFLRSPMVGLADDALWRLARGWSPEQGPLGSHLASRAADRAVEHEQAERLAHAGRILEGLRARVDTEPAGAVVAWLVDRTGYAAVLGAVPDRDQRRANLERLVALSDRAPSEGMGLLAHWVAALRRRVDDPPRDRDASPPEAGDRVLILSIHQAKGLEFPVVALADVGSSTRGSRGMGVEFDRDLGVVAKWWESPAAVGLPTRSYALASSARKERERAEETRLLYVAATRARDRLIFSAGARTQEGWWLPTLLGFARGEGALHVETDSLARWAERHSALASGPSAAPGPGISVLDPLPAAPGEATARELAAAAAGEAPAGLVPAAREAARLRMRRGQRAHRALERLPLRPAPGFDLRLWLGAAGVDDADLAAVADFVERAMWPRLGAASEIHRELPFRLQLPGPGGIVVGTIDCLWREAGGIWWVWDYKLASDDATESRHEAQISVYALAAAAALGMGEIRGALWYLESGEMRELRWDRAALVETEKRLARAFPRAMSTMLDEEEDE